MYIFPQGGEERGLSGWRMTKVSNIQGQVVEGSRKKGGGRKVFNSGSHAKGRKGRGGLPDTSYAKAFDAKGGSTLPWHNQRVEGEIKGSLGFNKADLGNGTNEESHTKTAMPQRLLELGRWSHKRDQQTSTEGGRKRYKVNESTARTSGPGRKDLGCACRKDFYH